MGTKLEGYQGYSTAQPSIAKHTVPTKTTRLLAGSSGVALTCHLHGFVLAPFPRATRDQSDQCRILPPCQLILRTMMLFFYPISALRGTVKGGEMLFKAFSTSPNGAKVCWKRVAMHVVIDMCSERQMHPRPHCGNRWMIHSADVLRVARHLKHVDLMCRRYTLMSCHG